MSMTDDAPAGLGHNNPPEPTLREQLEEAAKPLLVTVEALAKRANGLPKKVGSDEDLGGYGDVVKDARKSIKSLKDTKAAAKQPYIDAGKEIEAFFAVPVERLERIVKTLEDRASDWQRAKAEEARRVAAEEARKAREKADEERRRAEAAAEAGRANSAARAADKADAHDDRAERAEREAQAKAADLTRTRSASGTLATAKQSWKGEIVDIAKVDLERLRPFIKREALEMALNQFVRMNKGAEQVAGCRIYEDTRASFR